MKTKLNNQLILEIFIWKQKFTPQEWPKYTNKERLKQYLNWKKNL